VGLWDRVEEVGWIDGKGSWLGILGMGTVNKINSSVVN
jgi:hypothetical protein